MSEIETRSGGSLILVADDDPTMRDFLRSNERSWDIVFLDPPFDSPLLERSLDALGTGTHLHAGSIVYVESSVHQPPPLDGWTTIKATRTGDVQSQLVQRVV